MTQNITFRQIDQPELRKAEDGESRKLTFIASDGTRDSSGTVLNVHGWDLDRFNKNGLIGYQHKVYGGWDDTENPDNVIGKGHAYVEGEKLMVDVEFEPADINPLADKIYKKLIFGSLKAVSVGFVPVGKGAWGTGEEARSGSNPTFYYEGQKLLEVSVVNIPANPNALKKSFIEEAIEAEIKVINETPEEEPATPVEEPVEAPEAPKEEPQDKSLADASARELEIATISARAALL